MYRISTVSAQKDSTLDGTNLNRDEIESSLSVVPGIQGYRENGLGIEIDPPLGMYLG